jgi:hypothetical protein
MPTAEEKNLAITFIIMTKRNIFCNIHKKLVMDKGDKKSNNIPL